MAGRGMSLASIISASQQGAAQAMSMAEQERDKNPNYKTAPPGEKKTLDPPARDPGQGQAALQQEQLLLSSLEMGELMTDIFRDSDTLRQLLLSSGPNTASIMEPLGGQR